MSDLQQFQSNALAILEKSIKRAAEHVSLIQTRKENLMAMKGTDPMAINLVAFALATAKQELESLIRSADDLRTEMTRGRREEAA